MTGKPNKLEKSSAEIAIDEFSGGIGILQVLTGLFTVVTGFLDLFYILTVLNISPYESNDANTLILRLIVIFIIIILSIVTFSIMTSCISLLARLWSTNQRNSALSIQLLGMVSAIGLMYIGNIGIIILLL